MCSALLLSVHRPVMVQLVDPVQTDTGVSPWQSTRNLLCANGPPFRMRRDRSTPPSRRLAAATLTSGSSDEYEPLPSRRWHDGPRLASRPISSSSFSSYSAAYKVRPRALTSVSS